MEKWFLKNIKADLDGMSRSLGISKLLCKIMVNRNIKDYKLADSYIYPEFNKLHDPRSMKDIELGVNILKLSVKNNEKIRIVGDYDQDGNSSILTLYKGIKRFNTNVDYVIPHRVKDGYGINERIVNEAYEDGVSLIITCDNGISAFEPIKLAKKLGIKIIITDHHDIPYIEDEKGNKEHIIPKADAIINPKRLDCNYPFKELCGAGVAFKFIQVFYDEMGINIEESYEFLEYVAMGTVCDVVDLIDENRIIVKEGLKRMNDTENIGLQALIKVTGLGNKDIGTYGIGFVLGPCINAAGRLDEADIAVELFLTNNIDEAERYANILHNLNEERKTMTTDGYDKIDNQIEDREFEDQNILVIYEPDIHESIAGIIAGRIKDKYYKPTIVLTKSKDENKAKGSGRSITEYNMFQKISESKELLDKFGGHKMAAGLSLDISNIDNFRRALNEQSDLTEEDLYPKIYIDAHLPLDYISYDLIEELQSLEPYGKGNSKPLFAEKNIKVNNGAILGKNKNVLKLELVKRNGGAIEGIYFGDIEKFNTTIINKFGEEEVNKMYKGIDNKVKLDIIYVPTINEFRGRTSLQVQIQNYR